MSTNPSTFATTPKILGPINNSTLAPEKNIFLADFVENVYFPFLESEGMKEVALNHGARDCREAWASLPVLTCRAGIWPEGEIKSFSRRDLN